MYRVLTCIAEEHMPGLLLLAGAICCGANIVALFLLGRSATAPERRGLWLAAAGFTAGVGIWSTHFVAMLSYDPGFLVDYEVGWTAGSLAVAIALAVPAVALAREARSPFASAAAGTLFGAAIAGTHNLGMLGIVFPGVFDWNIDAVVATDVMGCVLSGVAFELLRRDVAGARRLQVALVLFAAIFILHFVGIGTAVAIPDPAAAASPAWTVPREILALAIAAMVASVLTLGASALWLDARMRAAGAEVARMRQLADATLEGIAILRGTVIADVNRSLAALIGLRPAELVGLPFTKLVEDQAGPALDEAWWHAIRRVNLVRGDGTAMPVEIRSQHVAFPDGPRRVVAVRDLRESAAAEAHIEYLARHDLLTSLLNRASLDERLSGAIAAADAQGGRFAVLYLDLDRFKAVNDRHGHQVGDELLTLVAGRLRSLARPQDAVGRLGGDEFVLVRAAIGSLGEVQRIAADVVAALSAPFSAAGIRLEIGASVGISLFPRDGTEPDELLRKADVALYKAKERKGCFVLFDPALDAERRERRLFEDDLHRARERGELSVAYRPMVSGRNGAVLGHRARLLWTRPGSGEVEAARFMPVAEASGLVGELGGWTLREACREAASWPEPLQVAVPVSAAQVREGSFPATVEAALSQAGLAPARLELDVQASALARDPARVLGTLRRLKAVGVRLALDGFGTAPFALADLQASAFDLLRIDGALVARVADDAAGGAVVKGLVRLARGLGLTVAAEGVDRAALRDALLRFGCDVLQGDLFDAAAPAALARRVAPAATAEPARHDLRAPRLRVVS